LIFLGVFVVNLFLDWIGFLCAIVVLLVVSRKNLPLSLFLGGITLGLFTLSPFRLGMEILRTLKDPSIVLLAIAVGIIPLIGGVMKEGGEIDGLVNNFRVGKKAFLALTPALMGMLPMPGGALLSAPMVERAGVGTNNRTKVAINVWFRHLFILIYPLSPALIASAKIVGLTVYDVIPWLVPEFLLASLVGYVLFLRHIKGNIDYTSPFSLRNLLIPLCVILAAPILDFSLRLLLNFPVKETATIIAVSSSFALSLIFSSRRLNMKELVVKTKPWNFAFIIIAMFIFLNVFTASDAASRVASLTLSGPVLCVLAGFLLGLTTGRVQLPASIILPVYLVTYGSISPLVFSVTYFSIFWGYIISPVHPCIVVTLEYFNTEMKDFYLRMLLPAAIIFFLILISSFFLIP
jgi:integral membrane protein (TIGR00529 family)